MSFAEQKRKHQTRKQRINLRLNAIDWLVVLCTPSASIKAHNTLVVREFGAANRPANYALCDQGHIRAAVKVKKLLVSLHIVPTSAMQYSKRTSQILLVYQAKL